MTSKVYLGDTGTVITLDCGQDVSSATARAIEARKPSGDVVSWTASASGADAISYTTDDDDIDEVGDWRLQAHVTTAAGEWLGETVTLRVYPAFG